MEALIGNTGDSNWILPLREWDNASHPVSHHRTPKLLSRDEEGEGL